MWAKPKGAGVIWDVSPVQLGSKESRDSRVTGMSV